MRAYIKNLTDNLIGQHKFDIMASWARYDEFLQIVQRTLRAEEVAQMNVETLGRVMCSFEKGDVKILRDDDHDPIKFTGNGDAFLRDLVALYLAYAIHGRLDRMKILPFRRRLAETR